MFYLAHIPTPELVGISICPTATAKSEGDHEMDSLKIHGHVVICKCACRTFRRGRGRSEHSRGGGGLDHAGLSGGDHNHKYIFAKENLSF